MNARFRQSPSFGEKSGKKAANLPAVLKRLMGYLRPYRARVALSLAATVLSTVFTVMGPRILGNVTSFLTDALRMGVTPRLTDVLMELILLCLLYLVSWFCTRLCVRTMVRVTQNIICTLRNEASEKLARLPLRYFDNHPIGDVMSRITSDVDLVSQTLQSVLTEVISAAVILVGMTAMMLTISPLLTLICILTLPAGAAITAFIVSKSQRFFHDQSAYLGKLNAHIEETFTGHSVVRSFSVEEERTGEFRDLNARLYRAATRAQFASGTSYPLTGIVSDISYISICVIGALGVMKGTMKIGDVLALIQYSTRFQDPIKTLSNLVNVIQSALAGAERCFEFFDEEEEIPDASEDVPEREKAKGEVRFENVSFSYLPEKPLIEHFDLTVPAGSSVAIVGKTGAGKTTLVNLLMRFYEVKEGRITIDGENIRDMTRHDLRKLCGMVLQDAWLFDGTIRENLLYGASDPDKVTEEEIHAALRTARLDHFVASLPEGLDTVLESNASNISAGQRQLLTIARAILRKPAVLILDEATSSVDTRTEQAIQMALSDVMKNRTSFIIAHRLSTIRHASVILVMENGSIVEQGDHDTLIQKKGAYWRLYQSQFLGKEE